MLFSDQDLARRLERTEGQANASLVEARQHQAPASGATWLNLGGTYAMFDGVDSPLTQSFGLGLFDPVGEAEFGKLESFFAERQAPVFHEVSPLAEAAVLELLPRRGYRPLEYANVLYRPLSPNDALLSDARPAGLVARRIAPGEEARWAETSAAGWGSDTPELGEFLREYGLLIAGSAGTEPFLAELNGQPIATGGLFLHQGAALLMGASTVAAGRRQGAQSVLLGERLRYAAERGCTLAMMGALPGSQSQRNAEKHGFRIAYTRIKWALTTQ